LEAKVYITNAQPEVVGGWQEFQHSQQWMDTFPKGMNLLPNFLPVQTDTVTF
jgi:hypothetical protein